MNNHLPSCVSIYVSRENVHICWHIKGKSGYLSSPIELQATPEEILRSAINAVVQAANYGDRESIRLIPIRLVISAGFSVLSQRPKGVWSLELAAAAASELEPVCPVPYDLLQTAAIPVGHDSAWVCGLPREQLLLWQEAANALKLNLEGVWTSCAVFIDFMLEKEGLLDTALFWQDGRMRMERNPILSQTNPAGEESYTIRAFANRQEPAVSSELHQTLLLSWRGTSVPISGLPTLAVAQLARTDPSESLNLLRDKILSRFLDNRNRRKFAVAIALCCLAVLLVNIVNLARWRNAHSDQMGTQKQVSALWHEVHPSTLVPPLPVSTLERESQAWQSASDQLNGFAARSLILTQWGKVASSIPPDLLISVTSIRSRDNEMLIEGLVPSPADARRLETAWSSIPRLKSDPLRLSSGDVGQVRFSARLAEYEKPK